MTLPEAPYRALDDQQVRDRWLTFFGHLEGADDVFDDVLSAYRRPGRYYHTIEHGLAVAQTARTLSEGMAEPDRLAIDLASWLHDARFSPGADDNEERSADLAADVAIRLGLDGARVDEIRVLVLATTHTVPATTSAQRLLCDADLAVLAKPWPQYLDDVVNIRVELGMEDDERWRDERLRMLGFFRSRQPLYHLRNCRQWWEDRARANQRREWQGLRAA